MRYLFDDSRAILHLLILIVSRPLLERAATLNDIVILHVLVADEVPAFRVLQHSIDGPTRTVTFTLPSVIIKCKCRYMYVSGYNGAHADTRTVLLPSSM